VLDVQRTGEAISVRGALTASARLECVRCLATFDWPVQAPLEVFAERAGSGGARRKKRSSATTT